MCFALSIHFSNAQLGVTDKEMIGVTDKEMKTSSALKKYADSPVYCEDT